MVCLMQSVTEGVCTGGSLELAAGEATTKQSLV